MESLVITGGSGMLGRALVARLHGEVRITAFSRSERAQLALRRRWPEVRWLLGDAQDRDFLHRAFCGAEAVVHAAALKHVDGSEREPSEYARVNVSGSLSVASVASARGLRAVGISTDKACEPRNVYGVTKMLMERAFTEQGHVACRYGNVFGSDGSVLDAWRRQLADRGVIRVTDPEMTRFFFPVAAAVDEVLWALEAAPAGTVSVPRLRAALLTDLAEAFTRTYGGDIEVVGPRPGEKRHESLLSPEEAARSRSVGCHALFYPALAPEGGEGVAPINSEAAERLTVGELAEWIENAEASRGA